MQTLRAIIFAGLAGTLSLGVQAVALPQEPSGGQESEIIQACKSGKLSNPTQDDWKKYEIEGFDFAKGALEADEPETDAATIGFGIQKYFGRPNGLECNPNGPCTGHIDDCKDWLASSEHGDLIPQAYIWYHAYSTLADTLYLLIKETDQNAIKTIAEAPSIVAEFITPAAGEVSWEKFAAAAAPPFTALSGTFSALAAPKIPGLIGAVGGIIGSIGAGVAASRKATVDGRVDKLGKLQESLKALFGDFNAGIRTTYTDLVMYNNISDPHDPQGLSGKRLSGVLKDGVWLGTGNAGPDPTRLLGSGQTGDLIRKSTYKMFQFAAINTAWRAQNVFIVFVPYDRKIARGGNEDHEPTWYEKFQKADCEALVKDHKLKFAMCDGTGMSILVNNLDAKKINHAPKGAEGDFMIDDYKFDWRDVVSSSVGAWRNTGWNAGIANDLLKGFEAGAVAVDDVGQLEEFAAIGPKTEGVFNIPVCQLFDLTGTGLDGNRRFDRHFCACTKNSAESPAQPGKFFRDHADASLVKEMKGDSFLGLTASCSAYEGNY